MSDLNENKQENKQKSQVENTTSSVEIPEKKTNKAKMMGIIVALVIVISAATVFAVNSFSKTPEEKLVDAMLKTNTEVQKMEVYQKVSLDKVELNIGEEMGSLDAAVIGKLLEDISFETVSKVDSESYKMETDMRVVYGRSPLLNLSMYMNAEYMALKIPELYSEMVYIKWEDIKGMMEKADPYTDFSAMPDFSVEDIKKNLTAYTEALDITNYDAVKSIDFAPYKEQMVAAYTESILGVEAGANEFKIMDEEFAVEGDVYDMDIKTGQVSSALLTMITEFFTKEDMGSIVEEMLEKVAEAATEQEHVEVYKVYKILANLDVENMEDSAVEGESLMAEDIAWDGAMAQEMKDFVPAIYSNIKSAYEKAMASEEMKEINMEDVKEQINAMFALYDTMDVKAKYVVDEKGYLAASTSNITLNGKEYMEAMFKVFEAQENMGDISESFASEVENIDFTVTVSAENVIKNINGEVEFKGIDETAVNFAEVDEMKLMEMYFEIMGNAQSLSAIFEGMSGEL